MLFAALTLVLAAGVPEIDTAKSALKALERKHGIDIVWEQEFREENDHGTVLAKRARNEDLIKFAPMLATAMEMYPAKMWESGKVETIVLSKECLRDGVKWGGFAVHARKALVLDISQSHNPDWQRSVFHHELFHLIDPIENAQWEKLNVQDFAYRPVERPSAISKDQTRKGFLNAYSRSAAGEDRAEIFAFMVSDPKKVAEQSKGDWVLKQKIASMKSGTAVYGLDAAWWKKRGF